MSRVVLAFGLHAAVVQEVALRFHALFLAWIHVGQVLCSSRLQCQRSCIAESLIPKTVEKLAIP